MKLVSGDNKFLGSGRVGGSGASAAPQVFFALSPSFVPRMNERIYSAGWMDGRGRADRVATLKQRRREDSSGRGREREREGETMGLCVRLSK